MLKIATFDIEVSDLNGDRGHTLCAVIKPENHKPEIFRIDEYPMWKKEIWNDSDIVKAIRERLKEFDVIVTHYGRGFDWPFLQSRLLKYGLPFLDEKLHIDCYRLAKKHLRISSRSLASLGRHCKIQEEKMKLPWETWEKASHGHIPSMDLLVERCISDTRITSDLFNKLVPLIKSIVR